MQIMDRRSFVGTSLSGVAAALSSSSIWRSTRLWGAEAISTGHEFKPDTLILSMLKDPTTSMSVQWVGPATDSELSIQYAVMDDEHWQQTPVRQKPYVNTDQKVYRCELKGLNPGTEYQFKIGAAKNSFRFRTMPAKANDSFQFVSGGDCDINEHAVNTNILAAKQEPYFTLIAGDLAYDNGKSPDKFTRFLQNYSQHMVDAKGRLIPILTCIGNHEVNGAYHKTRAESPQYLSLFDDFYAEKTFGVVDIGDYLSIVLLDTDHIAPISGEQTDWLEATLRERQERPHLIVANHVPAYPSYRPFSGSNGELGTGEDQRKFWCPLFERYNVDAVLEHHDHTFKRTHPLINGMKDKNGVPYLGDGSWGKLRVPKNPEERPYLAAVSSAYHMTMHRLEGEQRFHLALEESGKVADICHTTSKRAATKS